MKKGILLLLLAGGCAPHNHKAQEAISDYVRKTVPDPGSYVPISFGEPHAAPAAGTVRINHVYQAKTSAGVSVIESNAFQVDSLAGKVQLLPPSPAPTVK